MSPLSIFLHSGKRFGVLIGVVILAILIMPVMAVFALGNGTLSFLAGSSSTTDNSSSISSTTIGLYEGPEIAGDTYAWGNCTYWVYAIRLETGDPIPASWGNAATWASRAATSGYIVDKNPSVGAIMQTANSAGGLGHVAYVTAVDSETRDWTISEMNAKGLDIVDVRTIPAADALDYNFIHDKN